MDFYAPRYATHLDYNDLEVRKLKVSCPDFDAGSFNITFASADNGGRCIANQGGQALSIQRVDVLIA